MLNDNFSFVHFRVFLPQSVRLDERHRVSIPTPDVIHQDVVRFTDFNFLSLLGKGSFGKVCIFLSVYVER